MARPGVQQHQIAEAAYGLLMEEVRPTVDKVRHRLGTGSPNTISPMLDDWFKTTLPGLLRDRPAANEVEGLPAAAVNAFRLTWTTALREAAAQAENRLEDERQALRERESELAQQRERLARDGEGLRVREEAMQETVRVAHEQAAHLRRQFDELAARSQHLQQTVDQLQGRGPRWSSSCRKARTPCGSPARSWTSKSPSTRGSGSVTPNAPPPTSAGTCRKSTAPAAKPPSCSNCSKMPRPHSARSPKSLKSPERPQNAASESWPTPSPVAIANWPRKTETSPIVSGNWPTGRRSCYRRAGQ